MENCLDTVGSAWLAPPCRAVIEGLQAQNAALIERNRALERREPEAVVEGLRSQVASLAEHNRRLEHLLRELRRALFTKKSEKLHPDQLQLAFEALEGALAEAEQAAPPSPTPTPRERRPDPRRNIGHLPEHLPRIGQVLEPRSTRCPCGCGEMVRIGEDRTERLDIVPAQLRVIVTVRPKYACRVCEQGVTQASAPAHLIEGAIPSEGALAHVLVSKFADHLPLFRQSQMLARFRSRHAPLDAGRLGRQDGVPPQGAGGVLGGGVEDVAEPGSGRDPDTGSRPRPGQDEDGLPVGDGARRAGVVRGGPAGGGLCLCAQPWRRAWREAARRVLGHGAGRRLFRIQAAAPGRAPGRGVDARVVLDARPTRPEGGVSTATPARSQRPV